MYNRNEKPQYVTVSLVNGPQPPPPPLSTPPATDEGFAYSTLLRRASEESLLRNSSHPKPGPHHYHQTHSTKPSLHQPFSSASTTAVTPSAQYSIQSVQDVLQQFNTHPVRGLNAAAVPAIRAVHGPNEFEVEAKQSIIKKFLAQFYESPLNLLLLGSAGVSMLVGNTDDAISIAAAIIIVVTVGFIQEQRSEKSLAALNKLVPHYCHLTRDGKPQTLLANVLVPGDLVSFSVGDRIPADIRLTRASGLEIDESTMTGETKAVAKHTASILSPAGRLPSLAERANVALMGTLVKAGHGAGIVVGTGPETEFGVVFGMMQEVEERKTPLQLSMDELAKKLSAISFAVIGVICLIGVWQRRGWLEMFTVGVSLAVAAIPEGLPIVVTVTLALGVLRMSKRKAIVKKLHSVETLGSVSVICSDKTGTLTTNQMTVTQIFTVDDGPLAIDALVGPQAPMLKLSDVILKTLQISNVCVNAYRNADGVNVGPSTEVALLNVLTLLGIEDCRLRFVRKSETPFSSDTKFSAVSGSFINESPEPAPASLTSPVSRLAKSTINERDTYYMIGAPEVVLARCKFYLKSDSVTMGLEEKTRGRIEGEAEGMAKSGLRVLAMAYGFDSDHLIFSGLQGITDPPRKGVAEAVALLQRGGVQVVMITGDSEFTAAAISRQLGIRVNSGTTSCMTGEEIDRLTPRQLIDRVQGTSVFARVTPRHKMAIVEAFQAHGAIVAMTGDGVNDAPALRMADIGISMGKGATDVAKEAADLILVDDNFATLLPAIEEGKTIFYNIQNFLAFQLSTAVAALSLIALSSLLGLQPPLNAMQILFINILMDGPPSQSLGVDPVHEAVMNRRPRPKHAAVLTTRLLARIGFSATIIILCTVFVCLRGAGAGARGQTLSFSAFVFLDLVSAIQNRGLHVGLLPAERRPYNPILLATVSVSAASQLAIVYVPVLQGVFQTEGLEAADLGLLVCLGAVSFGLHEFRRRYERRLEAETDVGDGSGV
ncbi:hypothetical protein CROQUDRAFT_663012 [Cronartium quercuum f. sp. fusiforme G11]|uniref:P-type Ca(2+) transporter n=1 Tax=Cronartium quercuum f. sp. fusiforme G11 TaxID=708437 RepID=A0A9P6NE49_9BASI|nr:hypothetical protein CROQUDRAFT_663012 [Cronartium quercuum f. sp. fusiforme G11]